MKCLCSISCTILAALLGTGCAPLGQLDRSVSLGSPVDGTPITDVPVLGFNVEIQLKKDSRALPGQLAGELLAVDAERIWLMDLHKTRVIDRADVDNVRLTLFAPSGAAGAGVWTTLGSLSTLSHGPMLLGTLPLWLVGGIGTTIGMASSNHIDSRTASDWDRLYQFARFPQGMPKSQQKPCVTQPLEPPQPAELDISESAPMTAESASPPPPPAGALELRGRRYAWFQGEAPRTDDMVSDRRLADEAARQGLRELIERHTGDARAAGKAADRARIQDRWFDGATRTFCAVAVVALAELELDPVALETLWRALQTASSGP